MKYRVFLFLLDCYALDQRSDTRSANVASYAASQGGLTVDDGSQTVRTTFINSNKQKII
jgi:hypothetical protein